MKIGLKLWSINENYIVSADELFSQRVFDYIELFIVSNSEKHVDLWSNLNIPFILHAPHSYAGLNFSLPGQEVSNFALLNCVDKFRMKLHPEYIIFHPGINGSISETTRQINLAKQTYPELMQIAIIENKPMVGIKGEKCVGFSYQELSNILSNTSLGFCLDFGHAICAAYSQKKRWHNCIEELLTLKPSMYHISDGYIDSALDVHLNIGQGDFDFKWIISKIGKTAMVSLETKKNSAQNLDDFKKDCLTLKRMLS